jgi:hypothetical protein
VSADPKKSRTIGLTYIAAPYSDNDEGVVKKRYDLFLQASSQLAMEHHIVSGLLMVPLLPYNAELGSDWKFWKQYSEYMIERSARLIVLCLPGWTGSEGVRGEIQKATDRNLPIGYVEFVDGKLGEISWQKIPTSLTR